ncbi:hypothetical protein H8356DRAFT_1339230 [Neocallimastix lanati (nom. inval.)]|nr:hypothetical protein H8356DRAFT_1339230 [Neocallimastix sp. JGI-2020a]
MYYKILCSFLVLRTLIHSLKKELPTSSIRKTQEGMSRIDPESLCVSVLNIRIKIGFWNELLLFPEFLWGDFHLSRVLFKTSKHKVSGFYEIWWLGLQTKYCPYRGSERFEYKVIPNIWVILTSVQGEIRNWRSILRKSNTNAEYSVRSSSRDNISLYESITILIFPHLKEERGCSLVMDQKIVEKKPVVKSGLQGTSFILAFLRETPELLEA